MLKLGLPKYCRVLKINSGHYALLVGEKYKNYEKESENAEITVFCLL